MTLYTTYIFALTIVLFLAFVFVAVKLYSTYNLYVIKNHKPVIDIVVARYAEPLNWLCSPLFNGIYTTKNDTIINLYIYNKGGQFEVPDCIPQNVKVHIVKLENVGRCDHTYLYHICNKFTSLADVTIFLPGSCNMDSKAERTINIVQHATTKMDTAMICDNVGDVKKSMHDFQLDAWLSSNQVNAQHNQDSSMKLSPIRPFGKWFEHVFGKDTVTKCINWFGILAVSKKDILRRHVDFYRDLLDMVSHHNNPEVGHYIERSWYAIFQPESSL